MKKLMAVLIVLSFGVCGAAAQGDGTQPSNRESASREARAGSKIDPKAEQTAQGEKKAPEEGFRETPFGRVKFNPKAAAAPKPVRTQPLHLIEIEEKDDSVTFRKKTPFGPQVWTKKRSELTSVEREFMSKKQAEQTKRSSEKPTRPGKGESNANSTAKDR